MRLERHGPEGGDDLVCVLGWGNRLHHENVEWLLDQFVAAGYRVHAVQLPDVITDFEREYVAPVADHTADLGAFRLVGHSAGGLVAAYLDGATTTTYLSPWWGFPRGQVGLDDAVLALASRLPVGRPFLPSGTPSRAALGELATDRQLREGPSRAAPTFLREARRAHRDRPSVDDDAVVFCTLSDRIVDPRAVGDAVDPAQVVLYDGGHELFSSPCRERHRETLLAAVDRGADALDSRADVSGRG